MLVLKGQTACPCWIQTRPERGSTGEAGKGDLVAEAVDAGSLADDDGRGQHPAARDLQQGGSQMSDEVAELAFEVVDLHGQLLAADKKLPRNPGHHVVEPFQLDEELTSDLLPPQAAAWNQEIWVEFMEMPADLLRDPRTLNHQVMAVVREQLRLRRSSCAPSWCRAVCRPRRAPPQCGFACGNRRQSRPSRCPPLHG